METNGKPPWLTHPEFGEERLSALAQELALVWNDCLSDHDPDKGDDGWVVGCRFFRRACFRIKELVGGPLYPWLTILDPSFHFVFGLGGVPIRFFHGDEERRNPRAGRVYGAEAEARESQIELFPDFFKNDPRAWRMMVVTEDSEGPVLRVAMVRVDEQGEIQDSWTIPLEDKVVPFTTVEGAPKKGVEIAPPVVTAKTKVAETDGD